MIYCMKDDRSEIIRLEDYCLYYDEYVYYFLDGKLWVRETPYSLSDYLKMPTITLISYEELPKKLMEVYDNIYKKENFKNQLQTIINE